MPIEYKKEELEVLKRIGRAADNINQEARLIGGFVRDKLLKRPTKDMDIVCLGDGIQLAKTVAQTLQPQPKVHIFKNFGTAQIKWEGYEIEFVGARKESYRYDSRKPVVQSGTIAEDQRRRDFTINALSVNLNPDSFGKLIDPFEGVKDLQDEVIKTPLEPVKTFSDDPLRMMRAIRFATQLQFTIEQNTFTGIKENAERIRIVSKERITEELNKIILSKQPSIGFELLFQTEILHIIFPPMMRLHGVEVREGKGHKDNFYHTLKVLDNICSYTDDLWLRWA